MLDKTLQLTLRSTRGRRRGFTLIELLVVMTIIVLMVAVAVPAVRFIIGSRSTEAATNVVSAFLGRARSDAVQSQQTKGVFFFLDPDTDLTTMALVEGGSTSDTQRYAAWTDGQLEIRQNVQASTTVNYYQSGTSQGPSKVVAMLKKSTVAPQVASSENGPFVKGQWFLQTYVCSRSHTAAAVTPYGTPSANSPPRTAFWSASGDRFLEMVEGSEFQTLPRGVAMQIINDPKFFPQPERYLRTSCILFDGNGRFQSIPWAVDANSTLGAKLKLNVANKPLDLLTGASVPSLYSGFGLVMYDRETFKAVAPGASENDPVFFGLLPGVTDAASIASEQTEETWLDNNTLPLMINRQNGTLIKGE